MPKGQCLHYTDEMIAWLRDNQRGITRDVLTQKFNERFGTSQTAYAISAYCKRRGWMNGLCTKFQIGHDSDKKGLKQADFMTPEAIERTKATRFKKGHMPHNTVPVGTIAMNGDGYYVIKLRDEPGLTQREKWMAYHRYLYEQHYGVKLGKEDIIIFLDGDRTNCDIKNLKRISKRENQYINSKGLRFKDPELTKVGVGIARVATFRKEDDT